MIVVLFINFRLEPAFAVTDIQFSYKLIFHQHINGSVHRGAGNLYPLTADTYIYIICIPMLPRNSNLRPHSQTLPGKPQTFLLQDFF